MLLVLVLSGSRDKGSESLVMKQHSHMKKCFNSQTSIKKSNGVTLSARLNNVGIRYDQVERSPLNQ